MRKWTLGFLTAIIAIVACGASDLGTEPPIAGDSPILQVRSEGGFTTPELNLGRGPIYTLLADGRLIFDGPVIAIYPGPLLPNYQLARLDEEQVDEILALVERIGLPAMENEIDDSAAANVADATTSVVTYWDENGMHRYSVYALGIDPTPSNQATAATLELVDALSSSGFAGETEVFAGDRVRVIATVSQVTPDPEFEDIRPWPLEEENDPNLWTELKLGFTCTVLGLEVLALFDDATQATQWLHPVETMDAPPFLLQVRPLHPGEPDCPPSQ